MAFTTPTFNIACDIYTCVLPATKTFRLRSPCNLAMGRRITWSWGQAFTGGDAVSFGPALLLPPLTDIRSQVQGVDNDIVEVPSGSGRWYVVAGWDDVAKGFPNEYRLANLYQISAFDGWIALGIPNWPVPSP